MRVIGGIIGAVAVIVLLALAWRTAVPSESARVKEARQAVLQTFNSRPSQVVVYGEAVCGTVQKQGFIVIGGRLVTERSTTPEEFAELHETWCGSPKE